MSTSGQPPRPPSRPHRGRQKGVRNRVPRIPSEAFHPIAAEYLAATRAAAEGRAPLPTLAATARESARLHVAQLFPTADMAEVASTPLVWAHGGSTQDADALALRLRGGLRAIFVETHPNTRGQPRTPLGGAQTPTRGTRSGSNAAGGPVAGSNDTGGEVVVAFRTAFGAAFTPYGVDGMAYAGMLGCDVGTGRVDDPAPPWSLAGVTPGFDATVLWERIPLPAAGAEGAATLDATEALCRALALALTRVYARLKHMECEVRREMPCIPFPFAQRTAFDLGHVCSRVPPNASASPAAYAQWVCGYASRALYGRNPAGARWPFVDVGRPRIVGEADTLHKTAVKRAAGHRSEVVTTASELVIVVPRAASGPTLRALLDTVTPGWGYSTTQGYDVLQAHPALVVLLGSHVAAIDARNPSGSWLARTLAAPIRAGVPLDVLARRYGYEARTLPAQGRTGSRVARMTVGMHLTREGVPVDAQALLPTGYSPIPTVAVSAPMRRSNPRVDAGVRVAHSSLGPADAPPTPVVGLVVHPFTYAVQHPAYGAVVVDLDAQLAPKRGRKPLGVRGYDAHVEACDAAVRSPMWRVRAIVDPDPRGVMRDLERAVDAFVDWLLSRDALAAVSPEARQHGAIADFDAMSRAFRAARPRVTVQWQCAEGHPAGVPTLVLWCPVDAARATPVAVAPAQSIRAAPEYAESVGRALVCLWRTFTLGVAYVWGEAVEAIVLDALRDPAPAPELDPLGLAHAILDTTLRTRVAAARAFQCDALTTPNGTAAESRAGLHTAGYRVLYPILGLPRLGASLSAPTLRGALGWRRGMERTLGPAPQDVPPAVGSARVLDVLGFPTDGEGAPAILPAAAGQPERPLPARDAEGLDALPLRTQGRGLGAAMQRLARIRAALWPLAPGTLPRRVVSEVSNAPMPSVLPTCFAGGCEWPRDPRGFTAQGVARRTLREMGFCTLLQGRDAVTPVVSPPWVGPFVGAPRVAVGKDADGSGAHWVAPTSSRPFVRDALNPYGAAVQRAIAATLDTAPESLYIPGPDALAPDAGEHGGATLRTPTGLYRPRDTDAERALFGYPPWVVEHVPLGEMLPTLYPEGEGPPPGFVPEVPRVLSTPRSNRRGKARAAPPDASRDAPPDHDSGA